jgi:hypothetical protein
LPPCSKVVALCIALSNCHGGRRANAQNYPAGNCQISKSGGLFAQGSNPVSRDTPIWKLVSLIMWTGGL